MLTGQWWSSLVWQPFSQPMFAHPLAMRCTSNGLAVRYPGANITASKAAIMGGGSGPGRRLHHRPLGGGDVSAGGLRRILGLVRDGGVRVGHVVAARELRPRQPVRVLPDRRRQSDGELRPGAASLVGHEPGRGARASRRTDITTACSARRARPGAGSTAPSFVNDAKGKAYFSVALLPDNKPETLALFRQHAYNHVTDTRVEYRGRRRLGEGHLPLHAQAARGCGHGHALRALSAPVEIRDQPSSRR